MKKLLKLKELQNEVTKLLGIVYRPEILLCYHTHYALPTISIFTHSNSASYSTHRILVKAGVAFYIDEVIDEQIAKDIIDQIEKVMQ